MLGGLVREGGLRLRSPRFQSPGVINDVHVSPHPATARRSWLPVLTTTIAALLAGAALGLAVGAGLSTIALLLGLLAPFAFMLVLARPHWASILYLVLVYTDLLSILVRYHDFPALARYTGVALVSAVLGYRLLVLRERPATDKLTGWLLAYGLMVALGVLYARSPDLVTNNVIEFVRSFFTYLIVINTLTTMRRVHLALYAVMGAGVFLASLTLFQAATGQYDRDFGGLAQYRVSDIAGSTEAARPGGTIGDANYYGQMLLVVLPVALYLLFDGRSKLARLAGLLSAGTLALAVVLTYSRGDALALAAMGVAIIVFKRPRPLVLAGGALAILLALPLLPPNYLARLSTVIDVVQGNQWTIYGEDSIRGRAGATQAAIGMFADHPILGVGRENYPLYQLEYISGTGFARVAKGIPPHNLYLEVAAEHGVLGIIVFGGLLLAAWAALLDARRRFRRVQAHREYQLTAWLAIMFIGYLVTGLSLHGAFLYILWLIIAVIVAVRLIARSYTPVLSVLPARVELGEHIQASTGQSPTEQARRRRFSLRWSKGSRLQDTEVASTGEQHIAQPPVHWNNQIASATALSTRSAYMEWVADRSTAQVAGLETWLAAGEAALRKGDLQVARAMVELALERDPYDLMAWDIDLRIRLGSGPKSHSGRYVFWNSAEKPAYEVDQRMRDFWHGNGGVPVFGYPISSRFYEVSPAGELIEVQYFERARLEYRPALAGTPEEVQSGCLGREAPVTGTPTADLPSSLGGERVILSEHVAVPRRFFDFWEANNGPHVLGLPIGPVLQDTNDGGSVVWVQYFENARLECHPQLIDTVYGVQVSRLGTLVFRSKYGKAGH